MGNWWNISCHDFLFIVYGDYKILQSSFAVSFGGRFTLGALISFLVTLTDQTILNIGAPFWGLVFGYITSWLLERGDFKTVD